MSAITDFLKLEKPLGTENYDIDVHNRNADKMDANARAVSAALSNKANGNPATGAALNSEKVLGTNKIMTLDGTGYIDIPAGADLDDIKYWELGKVFRCASSATAETIKNCPAGMSFVMRVTPAVGVGVKYLAQTIEPLYGALIYRRSTRDNGTRTDWRESAETEHKQLTLINGWITPAGWKASVARVGNVATINAALRNPAAISKFTNGPFILPYRAKYAAIDSYAIAQSDKKIYRFEITLGGFTPGDDIPANTLLGLNISYICE